MIASECISEFTQSWIGEIVELDGRQPFMMTLPHLAWLLNGILEKECSDLKSIGRW
jgi:hypothetical protein